MIEFILLRRRIFHFVYINKRKEKKVVLLFKLRKPYMVVDSTWEIPETK